MNYEIEYSVQPYGEIIRECHLERRAAETRGRRISQKVDVSVYVCSSQDGEYTGHKAYYRGYVDHTAGDYA